MDRYLKKTESALDILRKMRAILLFVSQNVVCLSGDNSWLLKQVKLNANLMTGIGVQGSSGMLF